MPWLAALVCCSAFDIALHEPTGFHWNNPYIIFTQEYMNRDLAAIWNRRGSDFDLFGLYPPFAVSTAEWLPAWHLVGGIDPLDASELTGDEPDDGYPVLLADWIERDGLKCLKIKLRGNDGLGL